MAPPAFVTSAPVEKVDLGSWNGRWGCYWGGQMIGKLELLADQTYAANGTFEMDKSLCVPWVLPRVSGS